MSNIVKTPQKMNKASSIAARAKNKFQLKNSPSPLVLKYDVDEFGMPMSPPPESTISYKKRKEAKEAIARRGTYNHSTAVRGSAPDKVRSMI